MGKTPICIQKNVGFSPDRYFLCFCEKDCLPLTRGTLEVLEGRDSRGTLRVWMFSFSFVPPSLDPSLAPSLAIAAHLLLVPHHVRFQTLDRFSPESTRLFLNLKSLPPFPFYIQTIPPVMSPHVMNHLLVKNNGT